MSKETQPSVITPHHLPFSPQKLSASLAMTEIRELLKAGHSVTIPVQGKSMWPFLRGNGNKAIVSATEDIRVGDAVVFELSPGAFVLHRVIALSGNDVSLCGDGNTTVEHCMRKDVVAKVKAFIRTGEKEPVFLTSRKWRAYSWIWTRLRPVRRPLIIMYRAYCKIF